MISWAAGLRLDGATVSTVVVAGVGASSSGMAGHSAIPITIDALGGNTQLLQGAFAVRGLSSSQVDDNKEILGIPSVKHALWAGRNAWRVGDRVRAGRLSPPPCEPCLWRP